MSTKTTIKEEPSFVSFECDTKVILEIDVIKAEPCDEGCGYKEVNSAAARLGIENVSGEAKADIDVKVEAGEAKPEPTDDGDPTKELTNGVPADSCVYEKTDECGGSEDGLQLSRYLALRAPCPLRKGFGVKICQSERGLKTCGQTFSGELKARVPSSPYPILRLTRVQLPGIEIKEEIQTNVEKGVECEVFFSNESGRVKRKKNSPKKIPKSVKLHACKICGKELTRLFDLRRHQLTHTGERPHKCNICNKCFTDLSTLRRHVITHNRERQHKCSICDKRFTRISDLRRHVVTHTGERPYSCDICGKSFTLKNNLMGHINIHSGMRPYKCNICDKRFKQSSGLRQHRVTHTGQRSLV